MVTSWLRPLPQRGPKALQPFRAIAFASRARKPRRSLVVNGQGFWPLFWLSCVFFFAFSESFSGLNLNFHNEFERVWSILWPTVHTATVLQSIAARHLPICVWMPTQRPQRMREWPVNWSRDIWRTAWGVDVFICLHDSCHLVSLTYLVHSSPILSALLLFHSLNVMQMSEDRCPFWLLQIEPSHRLGSGARAPWLPWIAGKKLKTFWRRHPFFNEAQLSLNSCGQMLEGTGESL